MKSHNLSCLALFFALASLLNARAQNSGPAGIYEISTGAYIECCGIAGENRIALPTATQRFVALNLDAQSHTASLAILGDDLKTIFSIVPLCPPSQPYFLNFDHGLVFPDQFVFLVDPGPDGSSYHYTVTYSPSILSIDGAVRLPQPNCPDAPDQFSHTNVVAYLVAPPKIQLNGYSGDRPVIRVQGRAGWIAIVEASSDLKTWVEIGREVMPATRCAMCPFIDVIDTDTPGNTPRFYRSYQRPQ